MMNKLRILILIALGISLIFSLIKSIVMMRLPSASRAGGRKRLDAADWLDANSRDGALVKLTGIVRMREHERFVSPLSERRCVVLRLRALVRHGRGPSGKLV